MTLIECGRKGYLKSLCNEKRNSGMMGTSDGFDTDHPFCIVANNDQLLYFQPLSELLLNKPKGAVLNVIQTLTMSLKLFQNETGCLNRDHMLEVIQARIIEAKRYL